MIQVLDENEVLYYDLMQIHPTLPHYVVIITLQSNTSPVLSQLYSVQCMYIPFVDFSILYNQVYGSCIEGDCFIMIVLLERMYIMQSTAY